MEDFINRQAKNNFGIEYVFPYQRLVISNTLRAAGYFGEDEKHETLTRQIVLLPTGAGKSLCFMLPGILLDGITLIVFPLLSLMADQERRIIEAGSTSVVLKGGMSEQNRKKSFKAILNNDVKFILTNPETLKSTPVLDLLSKASVKHVVIDETHTVSQWGESFRPTYLEVGQHIKTIGVDLVTAYTATASDYIIESVRKHIFLNEQINIVRGNPDRTNIHYSVIPCLSKKESLLKLITEIETPAIIFHNSRVSTELTSIYLSQRLNRDDIIYYHAGLQKEEKDAIEKWFFESDKGILNATCAYGMGVDKQNIRTVIHLEAPSSIEAYLQESGRGGRDRKQAKAILLTSSDDSGNDLTDLFRSNDRCRREVLLKLLGADIDFCSGCDVCEGEVKTELTGEKQIIEFLTKNRGQFNLEESCTILKGLYTFSAISNQYNEICGFGIMDSWDFDSIKSAIKSMIRRGVIKQSKNILYRGKLRLL